MPVPSPSGRGVAESGVRAEVVKRARLPEVIKECRGTVLIIEDDPDTVELVRLYLARDGHKVVATADGREGLRLARSESPDMIVLDLMIPGLHGLEVCRILRQESEVPIVMLTARVEEEGPPGRPGPWRRRLRHKTLQPQGTGRASAGRAAALGPR